VDVVLLESGRSGVVADPLDFGDVTGAGFDSLTSSRQRGVGGSACCGTPGSTANRPRGTCCSNLSISSRDPRVAHSGWPVGIADLAPYYRQAENLAGLTAAYPSVAVRCGRTDRAGLGIGSGSLRSLPPLPASLGKHERARLRWSHGHPPST
jgi:choline dehydrogenase-like flavoprotein